jgi:hypothetical protein
LPKKTVKDKREITHNLDILKYLGQDIIARNPRVRALQEKYPQLGIIHDQVLLAPYYKEFEDLCREIWGEGFPVSSYQPVQIVEDEGFKAGLRGARERKQKLWPGVSKASRANHKYKWGMRTLERSGWPFDSTLTVKIDLDCTKEEIMTSLERKVDIAIENHKIGGDHEAKRKNPQKWIECLEVWDMKWGAPEWIVQGGRKIYLDQKKTRPFGNFEQIAKHKNPNAQTPDELRKASDRVKKQFKAADKLIHGKNPKVTAKSRTLQKDFCRQCRHQHCKETGVLCPAVKKELARIEVKQKHKLIGDSWTSDAMPSSPTRKKYLRADDQF